MGPCEAASEAALKNDSEDSCNLARRQLVHLLRDGKLSCREKEVEMREAWKRRLSREGKGFKMGGGAGLCLF